MLGFDAVLEQGLADERCQLDRPAEEPFVDRVGSERCDEPVLELVVVDPPGKMGSGVRVA